MRVYELRNDVERYQWLRAKTWEDHDPLEALNGQPVGNLGIIRVHFFREMDGFDRLLPSDFPRLIPGVPVLTARSLTILRDLVEPHAQILPLTSDDGQFFALNVTTLPKALDYGRSEVKHFRDGGVMAVQRYSFVRRQVAKLPIFKLGYST